MAQSCRESRCCWPSAPSLPGQVERFAQAVVMAQQFDARIFVLHAIEPLGPTAQTLVHNMLPEQQLQLLHSEGLAKLRSDIKQRIDSFCQAELGGAAEERVEAIRIVDGHPADVIVHYGSFRIDEAMTAEYGDLVRYLEDGYYSRISRYSTSAFLQNADP